ncbi:MAG: hypothetical protein SOZ59_06600 [Candidatus Limivivens sp.]|nr:hypothetical protein [Candidatus Limivivens sp.]
MKKQKIGCAVTLFLGVLFSSTIHAGAEAEHVDSLSECRQVLGNTDSICGVIYLGFVEDRVESLAEDRDYLENLLEQSGYAEDFSFLKEVDGDHIVETGKGYELYCIYPYDEYASVSVRRYVIDETNDYNGEAGELLYQSESGDPILLRCNVSDILCDSQIIIEDSTGSVLAWEPCLSLYDGCVAVPWEPPFVYDATEYSIPEEGMNDSLVEGSQWEENLPEDQELSDIWLEDQERNEYIGKWTMRVVNCEEWVSLRKLPDMNSERLEYVPLGATVTNCYRFSDEFIVGEYNGQVGFILSDYLLCVEPAPGEYDIWEENTFFTESLRSYAELTDSGSIVLDENIGNCRVVASRSCRSDEVLSVCGYGREMEALWGYVLRVGCLSELNATDVFWAGSAQNPRLVLYNERAGLGMIDPGSGELLWFLDSGELDVGAGLCRFADTDGTLYFAGYYGSTLVAVSPSGEILWRTGPENPDVYWPYEIRTENGQIVVDYESGTENGHFAVGYGYDGSRKWLDIVE